MRGEVHILVYCPIDTLQWGSTHSALVPGYVDFWPKNRPNWAQNWDFWPNFGPFDPMPSQEN